MWYRNDTDYLVTSNIICFIPSIVQSCKTNRIVLQCVFRKILAFGLWTKNMTKTCLPNFFNSFPNRTDSIKTTPCIPHVHGSVLTCGSMNLCPRFPATQSCIILVTLSSRKHFRIRIFWKGIRSVSHLPGRGSLWKYKRGKFCKLVTK